MVNPTERSEPARVDPRIEQEVQRDSVRALFAQTPQGLVIGVVLGALFVYVFERRVGVVAVAWYAALLCSQAWGWWYLRRFRQLDQQGTWSAAPWLRNYALRAWVAGAILGYTGWVFFSPAFGDARWLTVLILCGIAAGSVTSYAYHLPTLWGFLLLLTVPLWLQLIQMDTAPGYWVAHVVLVFYMSMLAWFGVNQHKVLMGAIRMRHENALLLAQLQSRTAELEEANQAKARFFAAASHDLRQPLHAMCHYTSLLKPHAQDAPHVERIAQCVESLDGLLEGVLSISRLDAGKVQRHITAVDMHELVSRLRTLYEGVARAKGLQLRVRLSVQASQGGVWVQTDPVLLERVLGNLLSNALRYTERGGVLLALRPALSGSVWHVPVIDTGPGIAAEQLDKIFDEFVQLNNPQRDPNQGVGLGLATVKRICALLKHPLAVRSQLGKGSRFVVSLPAAHAPAPTATSPEPASAQMQGRVLIVEDNDLVRDSLLHTLQEWGLQCTACADGKSALAALHSESFDVVLSDWRLPGDFNGLQVLAQARQTKIRHLLLMTGETDDMLGELPADVQRLPKPLRPIRLRALLSASMTALNAKVLGGHA